MTARKIDAMHRLFGKQPGLTCWNCPHLTYYEQSRRWYKCRLYGFTSSEATNWKKSNIACGMWGKHAEKGFVPVIERLKHTARKKPDKPIEGQVTIYEVNYEKTPD